MKWIRNWFSNMLPMDTPLIYDNIKYRTVENFYQAMKVHKDKRAIIASMNPYEAKKAIRNVDKFPWQPSWSKEKALKVMEYALRFKFAPNTSWGIKLRSTTGEIVEWNNWGDTFWGKDIKTKKGDNNLGKILMKIRDENN